MSPPSLALETTGSGEPLVLIHGLATTRGIWSAVVPRLRRHRRVTALDVPGFGQSPPAGDGFELEAVARRIGRGLRDAGVPSPYELVGHSLGGAIALTLAAQQPADVRRLVLVAPAGLAPMPGAVVRLLGVGAGGVLRLRRSLAPLADLAWARRVLLAFAAADPASMSPTEARLMLGASASAQRTATALTTIAAADLRPLLLDAPPALGVIWGTADRTVPARLAAKITEQRPDARVELIDGAGHVVMVERPDEFTRALLELLA
ncbi:MAG TPA: alpha/beta fold hydrolase [Solirubrobacteraceae bacterium]|nr:alpha/beta fold hydrolase [Solirubrobacteraceae bacterium]